MSNQAPILEAEVIQYLETHPEFFDKHLELFIKINIPHQTGTAVSLVEKQMKLLRKSNGDLKARFSQLMELARQNESHFENTKHLVLELLDFHLRQDDLSALIKIFDSRFPNVLAANEYRLILLDTTSNQPLPKKVLSLQTKDLKEKASRLMNMDKSFCGTLTKSEKDFLFGETSSQVASCAIIPLRYKNLNALIAIGNFKDQHFHKGMGTLFLDHIGDVVSRILEDLMNKKIQRPIAV